jgi:hypothetical protein
MGANSIGVHSAQFDRASNQWLASRVSYDSTSYLGFFLEHTAVGPKALIYYTQTFAEGISSVIQEINLSVNPRGIIESAWGTSQVFSGAYAVDHRVSLPTVTSPYPFLLAADADSISFFHNLTPASARQPMMNYQRVDLFPGLSASGLTTPDVSSPVIAIAGSSHWSTGIPKLFYIQQEEQWHDSGNLYSIALAP